MRLFLITAFTLLAFAANSLLTRMALDGGVIDPLSFTTLRLSSGALVLLPLARLVSPSKSLPAAKGSWGSGLALFAYAAAFSLAYVSLSTGMGALILFGAVQITMLTAALKSGEHLGVAQWVGTVTAVAGLVYLVLPGLAAPDPLGAALMGAAGIAWGVYSLRGRGALAPVAMTAGNFLRAAPLALIVSLVALSSRHLQPFGILLALTSGMVTSGLGYVLWYKALKELTTTQASLVQLLVPVLAAFGGVLFLAEQLSLRLVIASLLILGGVTLAIVKRAPRHIGPPNWEQRR
jgi:drug/metabolite transporter (DMT)-like permease